MVQTVTWLSGWPKEFAIWLVNKCVYVKRSGQIYPPVFRRIASCLYCVDCSAVSCLSFIVIVSILITTELELCQRRIVHRLQLLNHQYKVAVLRLIWLRHQPLPPDCRITGRCAQSHLISRCRNRRFLNGWVNLSQLLGRCGRRPQSIYGPLNRGKM